MLDAGVYLPPSAFEGWFLSAAHDDGALDRIVAPCRRPPRAAAAVPEEHGGVTWPDTDGRPPASGTARSTTPTGVLYGRLPDYHLSEPGRADGRPGRRAPARPRHRAPALLAAGAGPGDDGADRRGARPARDHRRPGDRGRQLPRGPARSTLGGDLRRPARRLVAVPQRAAADLGRAVHRDRGADAAGDPGRRRGRRRARGGDRVATSCRSGWPAATPRAGGWPTTRASASAPWPASPRSPSWTAGWSRSATPSRPATCCRTAKTQKFVAGA